MKLHRYSKKTIALALAAVMAAGLAGCRASDEIQKIVYTDNASEVDDTEFVREWLKETEEQDPLSDEKQDDEDTETPEEEMEEDRIDEDSVTEETAPVEAEEDETPNTEEAAQVAMADETGNNDVANDSDSTDGSGAVNTSADESVNDSSDMSSNQSGDADDDSVPSADAEKDSTSGNEDNNPGGDEDETGDNEDEGSGDGEGTTSEEGDNTSGEGTEPRKQIYDSDGTLIELPDSVNTIVAAGEAALITQMLGGEGVLLGSSSDFLESSLVQSVFADEGIADVAFLWDGDGSSPMSDDSFEELLELNPDCVLEISGETNFSSSQETALKEAQIYIVTLPALTSSTNICAAVETVGQLLDDHAVGDTTSLELAEQYVAYEEDLVAEVQEKKGTFSKKYNSGNYDKDYFTNISNTISDGDFAMILYEWDDSFSFTYSFNGVTYISQSGGPVLKRYIYGNPTTYYMAVGGVMNTASSVSECEMTLWIPFYKLTSSNYQGDEGQNMDYVTVSAAFGGNGFNQDVNIGTSWEEERTIASYDSTVLGTATLKLSTSDYFISSGCFWANLGVWTQSTSSPYYVSGAYAWLGTERFPYVITATSEIAEKLASEKKSSSSLYAVRTWGIEVSGAENYVFSGNLIGQRSLVVHPYTTQRHDYDIVVNPSGCGDWLNGSVESVLESVWVSNLYYADETFSDNAMEEEIREFYNEFYRHSLTPSELADILDGE